MASDNVNAKGSMRQWLCLVPLLTLCAIVLRLPFLGDHNADIDEQLYALIGSQMWEGKLPFVDLWDRKPFGLFLLFGLADATGLPTPWSYQLLATGFIVLGSLLVRQLSLLLVESGVATVIAVLYMVLMTIYGSQSAQSETFHVPAMLGMALLVRDTEHAKAIERAFLAMFIGGVALQIKYTVLPQCVFFGLWALWGQYRAGRPVHKLLVMAFKFAALGLLPTALVGLFYLSIGGWEQFWFANFVSFFLREPSINGRFGAKHTLFIAPLIILVISGLYARYRLNPPRDLKVYHFFWGILLAALTTVYLPSTVYAYYFAALVPGVLLVALPFFDRRGPIGVIVLVASSLLLFGLLYYPSRIDASIKHRWAMDKLVMSIKPHVDAEKRCLWVFDGPTALYQSTGSCLPTRFIYPDHLNNTLEHDALEVQQIEEVQRIFSTRPPVVVTADIPFTQQNAEVLGYVSSTLDQSYRVISSEPIHNRRLSVWLRNDLGTTRP